MRQQRNLCADKSSRPDYNGRYERSDSPIERNERRRKAANDGSALAKPLSADPGAVESPAWHKKELGERERNIESGKSTFVDWEKAKADVRRQTS